MKFDTWLIMPKLTESETGAFVRCPCIREKAYGKHGVHETNS